MPETPCLFENQTAVFLKCAEIDCALESAKKPRTAGLCGRAAGACDCGPLSCAFIERGNRGRKPPKRGMAGRENPSPKAQFSFAGAGFTWAFRTSPTNAATFVSRDCGGVHTPPQPRTAHTTAHRAKHGAISPSATTWLCAVSEIATERTAGESGCTPYGVCPLSPASRPRWAAQFFCASAKPTRSVAIAFILWYDKLAS